MKVVFFPHGDIRLNKKTIFKGNLWRETSFALFLLKQSVNPSLLLDDCIKNWGKIANKLAESPRKRQPQLKSIISA